MYIEKFLGVKSEITKVDVERLCKDKAIEHLYLEVKGDVNDKIDNLLKPFVAFANAKGGLLILGVEDKSKLVVGLDETWDEQKITNLIKFKVFPDVSGKFQIIKTSDSNCYLIDIEPIPFLVGIKINYNIKGIKLKYTPYLYFIRNAHESKQMDPSLVKQVAIEKADYGYNEDYRIRILNSLIEAEDTYDLIGNREGNTKYIIGLYVKKYSCKGIPNQDFKNLERYIVNCKLKNISKNIIRELIESYEDIINIRETIKHKQNLTAEEDDALNDLQNEFNERLGTPERPKKEQLSRYLESWQYATGNLSLKSYIYNYADLILGGCLDTTIDKLFSEYNKSILESINAMLDSYDTDLNDIKKSISKLLIKHNVPENNIINFLRMLDEFPEIFLKDYLAIMIRIERLKDATQKALYLEI